MHIANLENSPDNLRAPRNEAETTRLARVLFEEQERLLPEGDVWDDLDEGARQFWGASVEVVILELKKMAGERAG